MNANQAVIYAARTGEKLLLAKAQCKHGEFKDWLEKNCTAVKYTHAKNFMRLCKEMPELSKGQTSALLGLNQAIELLSAPEEIKTEVTAKIVIRQLAEYRFTHTHTGQIFRNYSF